MAMVEPSDTGRWLDGVGRGERAAADRLIEATYEQVYRALCRMTGGDADLAADLTQETYRKAWRSLAGFRREARVSTWLYRIAWTTWLNHVRRPAPVEPLDEDARPPRSPEAGADDRMQRDEVARRLRRAVLALPEELRFTVAARFWGELPVREIADLERVTGAAIRKRLKNALHRLRLDLEEDPS